MKPSILIAYPFLKEPTPLACAGVRDWVLDSGAYTALNTGKVIDLERFTADALTLQRTDPRLKAVFALDVIGDAERSLANAEFMRKAGVNVVPTWHAGSDVAVLDHLKANYERVAIGGLVQRLRKNRALKMDMKERTRWLDIAFERLWPKWIHGFGCTADVLLDRFPFASVDSTTWRLNPSLYGGWKEFGRLKTKLTKANEHFLRSQVDWFLRRERFSRAAWGPTLAPLGATFSIRLAAVPSDFAFFNQHYSTP